MLEFSAAQIEKMGLTWVGNKGRFEGVSIPKQTLVPLHDVAQDMLTHAFLRPFEKMEYFYFFHEEDVSNHPVFQSCMTIFNEPEKFSEAVTQITQRLYENMEDAKVKGGEFFIALFDQVALQGEMTRAVALVKIQSKDPYLKVERTAEAHVLNVFEGIPLHKLETAALIYEMDEAEGFRICVIDTVSKKNDRSFWKDDFLRIRPIEDNYFNTRHYISLSGEFISQKLPKEFETERADQLDLLYRSGLYFKENEQFEIDDFAEKMFSEPEQQTAFKEFRDSYSKAYAVPLEDQFDISPPAVKKEFKILKSVIKLDKNFHIYVHGRRDLIERGYDEDKGKKYYKVFFDDED